MSGHSKWSEVEHKATPEQLAEEREEIERVSLLTLVIPRDDFAKLMDYTARLEQAAHASRLDDSLTIEEIEDLSRVASDLSQQADAQD